jgi:hypothetical protein
VGGFKGACAPTGHDLLVPEQLDEVADRLAEEPLKFRRLTNNPLDAWAERRGGRVGKIVGFVGAVTMGIRFVVTHRPPDVRTTRATRRLYQQATGVDRDRAHADVAVVSDRLSPLVAVAPAGPRGDDLVVAASRRLVAWVAAGRPADDQMAGVEAAFARWVQFAEGDAATPSALVEAAESCVAAWEAVVRSTG